MDSESRLALTVPAADLHRGAGQALLAKGRLHEAQNRGMGDHFVAGRGPGHQRAGTAGAAQAVQAVRRGIDVGPHFGDQALAAGSRASVLEHREAMLVHGCEQVGVEFR